MALSHLFETWSSLATTLAIDTSTSQGGLAVLQGSRVLAQRTWLREKSHSEMLTPTLEECLQEAGIHPRNLERLVVGQGPGSFTGIRIAINAIRSVAFALRIPTFAYDTMTILAEQESTRKQPLLALVNAHRNLLYVSRFEPNQGKWSRVDGPSALSLQEIETLVVKPHLCVGDGYVEYADYFPTGLKQNLIRDSRLADYPGPDVLGRLPDQIGGPALDWNQVQALYIRASEAEEKFRERIPT